MSFYLLIIIQLIIMFCGAVIFAVLQAMAHKRDKDAWMEQRETLKALTDDQQQHNHNRSDQEKNLLSQFREISSTVNTLASEINSSEQDNWDSLAQLLQAQQMDLQNSLQNGTDQEQLKEKIDELSHSLLSAESIIQQFRLAEKNYRHQIKELQRRIRKASSDLMKLASLKVTRDRLQRDKERLQEALGAETDLMNNELTALRAELKNTEERLQRTLAEKQFIESHFMEMVEHDPEELKKELERKQREISMLETTVLDMHESEHARQTQQEGGAAAPSTIKQPE